MKLTLLCEQCNIRYTKTEIGIFEYKDLSWPIDMSIFKSWNPEILPDPFPAGMVDRWEDGRCRVCRGRPLLNTVEQPDGSVMIVTGEKVPKGYEGKVLTAEMGYVPIPNYPNAPEYVLSDDGIGYVVAKTEKEPAKSDDRPVACPICGQQYQSRKNLERFHNCKG